jgi:glutaredoxin-related protein
MCHLGLTDMVQAVKTNPLVVFMKGTPEAPQCGFSRAVCQILDVQVGGLIVPLMPGCTEGEAKVVQLSRRC